MKYLFAAILVAWVIAVGCTKEDEETTIAGQSPAATEQPTSPPAQQPTTTPATPSYSKQIGKLLLTVNGLQDYAEPNSFLAAEAGTHYVAVDITAKNTGNDTYALNPLNFKLQDSDKFTNNYSGTALEPSLGHVDMVPGQEVRAFLVFKIGDGRTPVQLQYQSFTGTPGTIDIAGLYAP